jgi:hypothetical protein
LKVELQNDKDILFRNIVGANRERASGTDEAAQVAKLYRDMLVKVGTLGYAAHLDRSLSWD